jgi:hypothetical protein
VLVCLLRNSQPSQEVGILLASLTTLQLPTGGSSQESPLTSYFLNLATLPPDSLST